MYLDLKKKKLCYVNFVILKFGEGGGLWVVIVQLLLLIYMIILFINYYLEDCLLKELNKKQQYYSVEVNYGRNFEMNVIYFFW